MFCSQCKSPDVEPLPGMIHSGGQALYPKRCRKCGFVWSDEIAPKLTAPQVMAGPELLTGDGGVDGALGGPDAPGAQATQPTRHVEPCDPDTLQVGEVIAFLRGDAEAEGPVAKVNDKTVWVDVDGTPDKSVLKSKILGRVIWR